MVLIQEQQIFSARDVQKGDARPGGYVTTGGHGGIIGAVGYDGPPRLTYLPQTRHSFLSEVNISRLPAKTVGVLRTAAQGRSAVDVPIKDGAGKLLDAAIPKVVIVKDGTYDNDDFDVDLDREIDLLARMEHNLRHAPLAGFVVEGLSPYGIMTSVARHRLMLRAVHSGMPVVRVGRGNNDGFAPRRDRLIGGGNLTATKARLLLMACLMKFGACRRPRTPIIRLKPKSQAIRSKVSAYQGGIRFALRRRSAVRHRARDRASASTMSSAPGRARIDSPTGRPSTAPSGKLTCGAPAVAEMVVSVLIALRCAHIVERGWPTGGAGNGAVGKQRIVSSESSSNSSARRAA